MTEKRFVSEDDCYGYYTEIIDNEKELDLSLHNPKKNLIIEELVDLLNALHEENQALKSDRARYEEECRLDVFRELHEENEQLKQQLDDLRTYDKEEFIEAEQINNIYKEKGFKGVIEYAKDQLQQYGVVKEVEKGLWVMVTGGWSDNEYWIHCLNNPISMFCMKHYRGYLRGGAFYYTEKPRGDVKIRLKGDME